MSDSAGMNTTMPSDGIDTSPSTGRFPAYPAYRDSGVPWLGQVPAHWTTARVKDCFRIVNGATPRSDVPEYWDGDVVWVTPADLSGADGWHIATSQRSLSTAGLKSCAATIVPPGSIIVSTRAPIGSIGIAAVPLCTNQGCRALVPHPGSETRFHAYALTAFTPQLNLHGRGTTFLELSGDALGAFPVCAPPPAEQRAIAAFLDRECGKMDALVAEQERLIMLLLQKRQRMIDRMVSYKEDGSPWPMVSAKWICRFEAGLHIQPEDLSFDPIGDQYIRTHEFGGFQRNKNPLYVPVRPKNAIVLRPEDGVICFDGFINSKGTGTIGLVRWGFNGILGPSLHRILSLETVDPRFPKYALSSTKSYKFILASARGATAQHAGHASNQIPVPLPPKKMQTKICDTIDKECKRIDVLIAEAETMISLLRERRSALISAAVTGQIDVRTLSGSS
jgi:type I restriction enzyme S subunit